MKEAIRVQTCQPSARVVRETLPHPQAAPMGHAPALAEAWSAVIAHRVGFAFSQQRLLDEKDVWDELATITGVRGMAEIVAGLTRS